MFPLHTALEFRLQFLPTSNLEKAFFPRPRQDGVPQSGPDR